VKELLKSDNICESYVQMKKCPVFLTRSVDWTLQQIGTNTRQGQMFYYKESEEETINCMLEAQAVFKE